MPMETLPRLETGMVIATRNPEGENTTPGSWLNHAMCVRGLWCIQGQADPVNVIGAQPAVYVFENYPYYEGFHVVPHDLRQDFADLVAETIGHAYDQLHFNCVTPLVMAWEVVMDRKFRCRHPLIPRPDDVKRHKVEPVWANPIVVSGFQKPADFFHGWTTDRAVIDRDPILGG